MQIKDVRPQSFTKQIRCDRCERLAALGDMEFEEFVSIDRMAGYASIFGDGHQVQLDLCQHCLKDVLGRWLRVDDPNALSLSQFDQDRHGGEFPTAADSSLQDRQTAHERLGFRQRVALLGAFFRHSVRLYFAPLTGAARGIQREYRRLERTDRERRRQGAADDGWVIAGKK